MCSAEAFIRSVRQVFKLDRRRISYMLVSNQERRKKYIVVSIGVIMNCLRGRIHLNGDCLGAVILRIVS